MLRQILVLVILVCIKLADSAIDPPSYEWPLGDTSVLAEVFRGKDMVAEAGKKCFGFPEGHPSLPYKSMRIGGNSVSHVEAQLSPDTQFEDITISILVFPEDASGETSTLLHYVRGEDNNKKEKIRIRIMATDFIITFRDQFDIPAGLILIDNPLKSNEWNHLVIVREFQTGRIHVYCNGANVYYGEDDEFPDNIPLEEDGLLIIGKAYIEEVDPELGDDEPFNGAVSCLQIFQYALAESAINEGLSFCQPEKWSYTPSVHLIPEGDLFCLSDEVPTTLAPFLADIITIRELTNENVWKSVKKRYDWQSSNRDTSYFKLLSRDKAPSVEVTGIGSVNTTNLDVCSRLCMRVDGCKSFVINKGSGTIRRCEIYDVIAENLQIINGFSYYAIRN